MKKQILALALTAALLLGGGVHGSAQALSAAALPAASTAQSSVDTGTGITPEQFGARGDGAADDLQALQAAMQQASASGQPLVLTPGAVYRFTSCLELPSGLTLQGNGAVLLSDIQYEKLEQDRRAVAIIGRSNEERSHDIRLEHVVLRAADSCQSNYMFGVMRARNVAVIGCTFDCEPNDWSRNAADLYGVNENILFENCVFRQLTAGPAGGIWVRNWAKDEESRSIRFQSCDFYKAGADEVLAVWGWGGTVRDVVLSGCNFYETETPECIEAGYRPVWFITLGQSGTTEVRMENCTVHANYCETVFFMVGDKTHAVVDNCEIILEQPRDAAKHDTKQWVNAMLARGNGRADGSTVIQNSRITLKGDAGRRICSQLSALKNNTLNVSLGYGIASTREVSGNTITGTIRREVLRDCDKVQNNSIRVNRLLRLGWPVR